MIRSERDEKQHRCELRKKYFEDPGYRKWSDIVPGGLSDSPYYTWRDDVLFMYFISGQTNYHPNVSELVGYLDRGKDLPINWEHFYAYFDEQINDPQNRYKASIIDKDIRGSGDIPSTSVRELLYDYRDELLNEFDMV